MAHLPRSTDWRGVQAAIQAGGSTLVNGNYRQADGTAGEFACELQVYGCEGEPCAYCGAAVERISVGQRGTFFCPCCQEATS